VLTIIVQGPQNYSDASKSAVSLLQRPLITEFHKFQPFKFDDTKEIGRKLKKNIKKHLKITTMLIQSPLRASLILYMP